jgi:hypothetical protein
MKMNKNKKLTKFSKWGSKFNVFLYGAMQVCMLLFLVWHICLLKLHFLLAQTQDLLMLIGLKM